MTISDDMYIKLANVSSQLGRERSLNDKLTADNETLRDRYAVLLQQYSDLRRDFTQYKERVDAKQYKT